MISTPARSGMPAHFGIRIADAGKDKLVGVSAGAKIPH
jgi:hypothetical protein